jgi:hypothetical protein
MVQVMAALETAPAAPPGADRVNGVGDGTRATDWCTLVAAMSTVSGTSEHEATVAASLRRRR